MGHPVIYLVLKVPVTDVSHGSAQACDQWPVRAVRRRDVHGAVKMKSHSAPCYYLWQNPTVHRDNWGRENVRKCAHRAPKLQ